jgi:hypothetical protein
MDRLWLFALRSVVIEDSHDRLRLFAQSQLITLGTRL